jgi:putative aminopeptidase FrvX
VRDRPSRPPDRLSRVPAETQLPSHRDTATGLDPSDLDLLRHLTAIPTVAGREERAVAAVERWAAERPSIVCRSDAVGNLVLTPVGAPTAAPLWVTAHLDHPGFVVTGGVGLDVEVEFRGGVRPEYFEGAAVEFHPDGTEPVTGRLVSFDHAASTGLATADDPVPVGTIGRFWFEPGAVGVRNGHLHAPACDDLAGVAAALSFLERVATEPDLAHIAVLLTRAEEVGFVGAVGAVVSGSIPEGARLVCLETSRAFPWAPIGAGPVVRVGDRVSVFSPALTGRVSDIAAGLGRPTQRKLMDGGACEATAFVAAGFEATCVCLPLGNYHNQGDLDRVERDGGPAQAAPEFIALDDHAGLIDVLVAIARGLDDEPVPLWDRLVERYEKHRSLLERTY